MHSCKPLSQRRCTYCKAQKPLSEFGARNGISNGHYHCKACNRLQSKASRVKRRNIGAPLRPPAKPDLLASMSRQISRMLLDMRRSEDSTAAVLTLHPIGALNDPLQAQHWLLIRLVIRGKPSDTTQPIKTSETLILGPQGGQLEPVGYDPRIIASRIIDRGLRLAYRAKAHYVALGALAGGTWGSIGVLVGAAHIAPGAVSRDSRPKL